MRNIPAIGANSLKCLPCNGGGRETPLEGGGSRGGGMGGWVVGRLLFLFLATTVLYIFFYCIFIVFLNCSLKLN